MNTQILSLVGLKDQTEVSIIPESKIIRDAAIAKAKDITTVSDSFESECAADALRDLQTLERRVEAVRKQLTAPVLRLQRDIMGKAKEFIESVSSESERIGRLLGEYQAEERKRIQEAERKARQEARRLEEDRLMRLDQERQNAITSAIFEGRSADLEKLEETATSDIVAIRQAASLAVEKGPSGISTRGKWCFEIDDFNLLFDAHPELFSPDEVKIRAAIKISQTIPGLRIWREFKASAK